jgi:hypothetical protein
MRSTAIAPLAPAKIALADQAHVSFQGHVILDRPLLISLNSGAAPQPAKAPQASLPTDAGRR